MEGLVRDKMEKMTSLTGFLLNPYLAPIGRGYMGFSGKPVKVGKLSKNKQKAKNL